MNQPPLNPDAQTRLDIMAGQIGAWMDEWEDAPLGTLTAHMATHVANRLAENGVTTLAVAQPVVNSVDPRELNRKGWTCGCEPGNYDSCEECQSACDELADFLNRPEVSDA